MTAKDRFSIAALGLEERDQRLLKSVFAVSRNRKPEFHAYTFDRQVAADVVLVNAESPRALNGWQAYQRVHATEAAVIFVGGYTGPVYRLARPLIATRLLAMLEKVATEQLAYQPALAIEGSENLERPAQGQDSRPASAPGQAPLKALVVDDSLPVRTQMKLALRSLASHVDFAETSEQAETLITDNTYDVVFLDVILPGKDGYQLCRQIKQDPEKRRTPVIMLTSNSSPADRIKGKLAGCDTYLIKPVRNAIFQEVLRELTDVRGQERIGAAHAPAPAGASWSHPYPEVQ